MTTEKNDHEETGKPELNIGGDVHGQAAAGENVIQIGSISGGEVVFHRPGKQPAPQEETATGPALTADLYTRLRTTLLNCGPFEDAQHLAALFVQAELNQWQHDIPEAESAGERVERVIAWLIAKEREGENGLVILLRALAGRYEPPAGCHAELETLANELAGQLG